MLDQPQLGLFAAPPSVSSGHRAAEYLRDSYLFEWDNFSLRTDLAFMLAIALCLAAGIDLGHPGAALIAAGGAMTVGMGAKQNIEESHLRPMIFVSLGMAISTFVGTVAGHEIFVLILTLALWGFGYGMLTTRAAGYAWVGQQCVVSLIVASAFPYSAKAGAIRALLVLAGGAVQILCTSFLLSLLQQLREEMLSFAQYVRTEQLLLRATMADAARSLGQGRDLHAGLAYSIRVATTLAVSTLLNAKLQYKSGYWIPMTALLVLKPGISDTASRAIARTIGSLAGAILSSFAIAHLAPGPWVLAVCTVLFAWFAYATVNVNYALFSVTITGYIVSLLSLGGVSSEEVAEHRAVCTVIGGALALTVRLAVIGYRKRKRAQESEPATSAR